jgi:tetratricopeptide (TPR) repeat protein
MDDRRRRLDRIRAEIESQVAAGLPLDPADWVRRHPDLQPELGELLDHLLGLPPTLGPAGSRAGPTPTAGDETVAMPTASPGGDPEATTALGGRPSPDPGLPGDETVGLPASSPGGDPEATTALAGPADATGYFDPATARTGAGVPAAPGDAPLPPGQRVRYIGDYELISVLGRGGMGVVYRARQVSLNRPVALKMISNSEFASDEQIRRFQNEAEAVAALDHPGIVPVYEVGIYEDQRYFSMKLIQGRGMEKALADLKANPREVARVVAEVADAVHHAHQRGILHRDLKPANILLDHENHAHVTDFGLAKKIEGEDGLTITGAVMGTPAYMSPEQAAGHTGAITTATDVYGIGALFFAALTDRAPFVGNSLMLTLDRVRNNPPDAPRRLNPGVPRDLEVICLKCLEKDPRRRYASAQDLAADLRRWMAGEPISARPVGPAVRLGMWARRKPALAALSVAFILASILGVAGIAWQWRVAVYQEGIAREQAKIARAAEAQAALARDAAVASEKVAVAARAEAEKNFQTAATQATLSLNTIQDLITRVSKGLKEPNLFDLKTEIIEQALQRLEKVAAIFQGSTSKEATALASLMELGKIYRQTGRIEKATAIFKQCERIARDRIVIKKGSDPARFNLATVLYQLAGCALENDRDVKASIAYELEALAVLKDILDHPMRQDRVMERKFIQKELGDHYVLAAIALAADGQLVRSLEEYRRAYNVHDKLLAETKDDPELIQKTAFDALTLANGSFLVGRREAAEKYFATSRDLIEQFFRARKGATEAKDLRARHCSTFGLFRFRVGDHEGARREYEAARDDLDAVIAADPQNTYPRIELAQVLSRLGRLEESEHKPEAARKAFERAAQVAEQNFRVDDKNTRRKMALMIVLPRVGQVDRGAEMADQLIAGPNVDPQIWVDAACTYAQSAKAQPPDRAERAQVFQVKAVDAVRSAIKAGFREKISLEIEPDLDPIRHRDDFQSLLREMPPPA